MSNAIEKADVIESALIMGDLGKLTADQRVSFYNRTCESLGLNPLTKPFDYITLNGKLTLYARRDCGDQLRRIHNVAITIAAREERGGVFVVTARATLPNGRTDESIGAVPIDGLKGENLSNAYMKAETKAKRRVTLSICGLGMLDESEAASVPHTPPPTVRAVVNQSPALPAATENGHAKGTNGTKPPDAKKVFCAAVKKWSGMEGKTWADACHSVAKKLGHESASNLADDDYADLTSFCEEAMASGVDFIESMSDKNAVPTRT